MSAGHDASTFEVRRQISPYGFFATTICKSRIIGIKMSRKCNKRVISGSTQQGKVTLTGDSSSIRAESTG